MRAVLIRSARCRRGVPTPRPGQSRLLRMGIGLLLVVFTTTGCIRLTTAQRPTSRGVYSTRSNALPRSKARTPVTTEKPAAPPQGEEEGGRGF